MGQRIVRTIATCLLLLTSVSVYSSDSRNYAIKAYHMMEESPFDQSVFSESLKMIDAAYKADPNEAWVYIAYSLAVMQQGYKVGTWYKQDSFNDGVIDSALEFAIKANDIDKEVSQSYAHLARVYVIKAEYKKAWGLLNTAYQLDNDNYYAWFYKALISFYMKDYKRALSNLDSAEVLIKHRYQRKLVTRQKQNVARMLGDKELEEKMYKKNIGDFPDNAYMYGNYGAFLYKNKRYTEAVEYYSMAVSIKPYPNGIKWLNKSKQKAGIK